VLHLCSDVFDWKFYEIIMTVCVADRCAVVTYVSEQSATAAINATGSDAVHLNDRLHFCYTSQSVTPLCMSHLYDRIHLCHTSLSVTLLWQVTALCLSDTSVTGNTFVTPLCLSNTSVTANTSVAPLCYTPLWQVTPLSHFSVCQKTSLYCTHVNGNMQGDTHWKQQKS